jgi:hypothetical protein
VELNNGRAAMMGILGMMVHEEVSAREARGREEDRGFDDDI